MRGGTSITHQGMGNSEFQGGFRSWQWERDLHWVMSPHRASRTIRQKLVAFEQKELCQAGFNSW